MHQESETRAAAVMGRGAGGSTASPARAIGGMCDRFLTFLANGLSMSRKRNIAEGPRNSGGGYRHVEEEDEFAIRIERAEFEFSEHGDEGHGRAATVLEDTSTVTASDEQQRQKKRAVSDAAADHPVPAAAPAVEETKIRKTVTIKEDRPADAAGGGGGNKKGAPALEGKKKLLFKRRQASTSAPGEEHGGRAAKRRSGLRPRKPAVPRAPSNINEWSSTFVEERTRSFGSGGSTAPAVDK